MVVTVPVLSLNSYSLPHSSPDTLYGVLVACSSTVVQTSEPSA